jgi:hypothetical protein
MYPNHMCATEDVGASKSRQISGRQLFKRGVHVRDESDSHTAVELCSVQIKSLNMRAHSAKPPNHTGHAAPGPESQSKGPNRNSLVRAASKGFQRALRAISICTYKAPPPLPGYFSKGCTPHEGTKPRAS